MNAGQKDCPETRAKEMAHATGRKEFGDETAYKVD